MGKQYRTREGEASAIDTKTALTTCGSETAPGPLLVPEGCSMIDSVIVACVSNYAADGEGCALVRLEGSALKNGPECIVVGGFGNDITTGARVCQPAKVFDNLDLEVTENNELQLFAEMTGTDQGAISVGVTVVFK